MRTLFKLPGWFYCAAEAENCCIKFLEHKELLRTALSFRPGSPAQEENRGPRRAPIPSLLKVWLVDHSIIWPFAIETQNPRAPQRLFESESAFYMLYR